MSGWGTTIAGLASTVDIFDSIKAQWEGETLYLAGPTVSYAVYQEQGTSTIEARPFVKPAAERVQADPGRYAQQMAATQGIDISNEAGFVKALALAVQNEAKRIANEKGVRDTGDLIASISIEQVS